MKTRHSRYAVTWQKIQRWYEEGRGQGSGPDYKPWLTVHDVPSRGLRVRAWGFKAKRTHHLLSRLEYRRYLMLEHDPEVVDIQEQYPLPLELTKAIARELKYDHPWDRKTDCLVVMTTDFLYTLRDGRRFACNAKYQIEQDKPRVREKFEIEKICWERLGTALPVTDNELSLSHGLIGNILWLRGALRDGYLGDIEPLIPNFETRMKTLITETFRALADLTDVCDQDFACEPGTSLAVVKWLLAHRCWKTDLTQRISTLRPLQVQEFAYGSYHT